MHEIIAQYRNLALAGNQTKVFTIPTSVTWTCGTSIQLRNILAGWDVGQPSPDPLNPYTCPAVCKDIIISKCNDDLPIISVVTPPTANFTFVCDAPPSIRTIVFTNTSTGGPAAGLSYVWNFGDGTPTVTTANPTHTFPGDGPYDVTLTTTNSVGSDTETKSVNPGACCVPSISCPTAETFECSDQTGIINWLKSVTFNGCGAGAFVENNYNLTTFTGCYQTGTQTVTFTLKSAGGDVLATCMQTITINPPPKANFVATVNIIIACGSAPTSTSLDYTNGGTAPCLISGTKMSTITGSHTACGGSYTESWTFTDACGRTSTASRMITVTTATLQTVTAPINITLNCEAVPAASRLNFTNSLTGNCLINVTSNLSTLSGTLANCTAGTVTETWTAQDICGRTLTPVSRTITRRATTLLLGVDTKEPLCQSGRGGKVTLNATDGCGPYTYKYSCGNGSVNHASNVLTGAANGTYIFTVTDALGCTATTTAILNCSYPTVCTYSQGAFGQPGGMIHGKSTYEQLKALLDMNPLMVGSGSKSLTLTTAECVDNVLPSSGTSAALSGIFTCPPFPASNSNSVYKNTLLGQCIALSLSVRLPNNELSGLKLSEICGITIPTGIKGISSSTTVSDLIAPTTGILNQALSGSKDYSKNLGTLTKLAGDIIVAYDGCRNPCVTAPACPTVAPIVNQGSNLEKPIAGTKTINKMADFKVFPVPSDGVVNLDMEDYRDDNIEIKIFNTMSQMVYTQKIQELQQGIVSINLSDLANGAYIISVKAESKKTLSKVMIINK